MKPSHIHLSWGYFVFRTAVGISALLTLMAVLCWALNWRSLSAYGDAVVIAGSFVFLVGLLGYFSGLGEISHRHYQMSHTWIDEVLEERLRQWPLSTPPGKVLALAIGLGGLISVGVGWSLKMTAAM